MSIRKRKWTTKDGTEQTAWVVDYRDQQGRRVLKTFQRKKDADEFAASSRVEVRAGTHVASSASITVKQAGELWMASAQNDGLERTTWEAYQQHLDNHILPSLGLRKLADLSTPLVRDFQDRLRDGRAPFADTGETRKRSPAMVKKILASLGSLLADAQERGLVARNVVRDLRSGRKRGKERSAERRQRGNLKSGIDIPTPAEIKAIIGALEGSRWRPLLLTGIFTGLRASELRGLKWADVDLKGGELHVRQRADRYNKIGEPKSEAGSRTVPLPPEVIRTLREWRLACPKGGLDLVFPNGEGNVENHANIIQRALIPTQIAAGVTVPVTSADGKPMRGDDGKPVVTAKYTGLHALRHFYASWCINRKADGGLELPLKLVQARLGHASIQMTADRYGHLFPRGDDGTELAAAEKALLG